MPVSFPRLVEPLLLALIVGTIPGRGSVAHADPPPPPAWEKIGDDDGITVYRREIPGSPIIAFKGEGDVSASILRVASVLVDTSRATEWIDSLTEARVLKQISEDEYIEYDHVSTPFVLKDRDFVIDAKVELDPAQKRVALKIHSVTDPLAPETKYVRGELMQSSFTLTALDHGQKTHIVAEIHADPKGSVAKWIVNMFQKGWPHNTITSLREQVHKPDIRDHARLKEALTDKGYFQ
jgi:START domain